MLPDNQPDRTEEKNSPNRSKTVRGMETWFDKAARSGYNLAAKVKIMRVSVTITSGKMEKVGFGPA